MSQSPEIKAFFDADTYTVSYVVSDPETRRAAIIDSVLDFDSASGRTSTPHTYSNSARQIGGIAE